MRYLKKFNENIESQDSLEAAKSPKVSTSSTPGTKIIKLDVFDLSASNILRGQINARYTCGIKASTDLLIDKNTLNKIYEQFKDNYKMIKEKKLKISN